MTNMKQLLLSATFAAVLAFGLSGAAHAQSHVYGGQTGFGTLSSNLATGGMSSGMVDGGGSSRNGQWAGSGAQSFTQGGATTFLNSGLATTNTWANQSGSGASSGNAGYDFGAGSTAVGGASLNSFSGYSGFSGFHYRTR